MGDIKGFKKYARELPRKRPVEERINDYNELYLDEDKRKTLDQSARCMDCGVPFCHSACPLGNIIPDFNNAVYELNWEKAFRILKQTNNFPEFTGRICPAPCEEACVLGINNDPVTIEWIEKSIAEKAYEEGYVKAQVPKVRSGFKIAVVGSGPAGLAASDQLNQAGHEVHLFERSDKLGGLLRYGIPDFKLEKWTIDRRLEIMREEGVQFHVNTNVGVDLSIEYLQSEFSAIVLAGGSTIPRNLSIPGRELKGVHYAMEYLEQKNRQVAGITEFSHPILDARGKHVVVIGGGDTGADCVGTSNRDKAASVTQIELLTQPPVNRDESTPWPLWPMQMRSSSSHEEGCERKWSIMTKEFVGDGRGNCKGLKIVDIEWTLDKTTMCTGFTEIANTERIIPCDLALLAVGFIHPQHEGLIDSLGLKLDVRGNVSTVDYQTDKTKIFAAGDMRRGQSLVVWAIAEGRETAVKVDEFLSKRKSKLDFKEYSKLLV